MPSVPLAQEDDSVKGVCKKFKGALSTLKVPVERVVKFHFSMKCRNLDFL